MARGTRTCLPAPFALTICTKRCMVDRSAKSGSSLIGSTKGMRQLILAYTLPAAQQQQQQMAGGHREGGGVVSACATSHPQSPVRVSAGRTGESRQVVLRSAARCV